jgi:hypothetical protein
MATTIEIEELTGFDLDNAPPCEFYDVAHGKPCGEPSVVRMRVKCSCGEAGVIFLCQKCREMLEQGGAQCLMCFGSDLTWGES